MLKIKVDNGGFCIERATGSLRKICAETCIAIRGIYDTFRSSDAEAAEIFRQAITACVNDEIFWSMRADEEDEEASVLVDWDAIRKTIERGGAAGK